MALCVGYRFVLWSVYGSRFPTILFGWNHADADHPSFFFALRSAI